MADQQDRPDEKPDAAAPAAEPASSASSADPVPPATEPPAPPAKKTPAKAAKKAPAKAAKKAPPTKAAKKSAPKKAPPTKEPPAPKLAETNGDLMSAAKEAAAQAKSTVASAPTPSRVQPRCHRSVPSGRGCRWPPLSPPVCWRFWWCFLRAGTPGTDQSA